MRLSTSLPRLKTHTVFFTPKRWGRSALALLPSAAFLSVFALLARGGYRALGRLDWLDAVGLGALVVAGFVTVSRRLSRTHASSGPGTREELEFGGMLLAAAFVAVALGGELLFPLVYLLMAFLVTFFTPAAGGALAGSGGAAQRAADAARSLGASSSPARSSSCSSPALYHLVLSARLALARHAEAGRGEEQDPRDRGAGAHLPPGLQRGRQLPGVKDQEKWLVAAVKEIEGAAGSALEVAETSLSTHTVAVFLLTSDDRSLKLHDCRSASERVQRERFPAGEGIFGALLKRGVPVRMNSRRAAQGRHPLRAAGPQVRALLAVPIVEGAGLLRGVLVADRLDDQPFTDDDERLLSVIAGEVLRAIEVERVMSYIRRARDEKDRFFRAIEELNRAGSPEQVFLAVLESARQMAPLDFCAVTLVSEEERQRLHRIVRMSGVTSAGPGPRGPRPSPTTTGWWPTWCATARRCRAATRARWTGRSSSTTTPRSAACSR